MCTVGLLVVETRLEAVVSGRRWSEAVVGGCLSDESGDPSEIRGAATQEPRSKTLISDLGLMR